MAIKGRWPCKEGVLPGAHPGFPVGEDANSIEGRQRPMLALFGENERIGSRWGGGGKGVPGSVNDNIHVCER